MLVSQLHLGSNLSSVSSRPVGREVHPDVANLLYGDALRSTHEPLEELYSVKVVWSQSYLAKC